MRWLIALAAASVILVAYAIEPPKPAAAPADPATQDEPAPQAPAPTTEQKPADDAAAPAQDPASAEEEELPPLPPEAASAGPSPQRFNPTEKVRADFPVSFPIDI